jgi:4-amino-4-deoxy-L-arabinose transferase-like glycosyltransferase
MTLQRIIITILFAWALLAVFAHLGDVQLEFYDEARRGVSALEMSRGEAPSLLTPSYYGGPDHWGTKPPLLVWCQAIWMKIIGPGELAVRMPSALATLALFWLLTWWGKRDWGSPLVGSLAAVAVLGNWFYISNHGARSGDFDAMLILFLTAQVIFFYRWVADGQRRWIWLAGLSIFLAGMTKGVAGGFFLPGIGVWLLLDPEGRKKLLRPSTWLIPAGAIGLVLYYYYLREQVDPGYIEMVFDNELGGRFEETNEGHDYPFNFYLILLITDEGWRHLLPLLVPAFVYLYPSEYRRPTLLLSTTTALFLLVVSNAATKLVWYHAPCLPLLGMLIGAGTLYLGKRLAKGVGGQKGTVMGISLMAGLFLAPMVLTTHHVLNRSRYLVMHESKGGIKEFMSMKEVQPPYSVVIKDYQPNYRFYVELARERGEAVELKRIQRLMPFLSAEVQPVSEFSPGERVVVCHSETWEYLFDRFMMNPKYRDGRCQLVLLGERRLDTVD